MPSIHEPDNPQPPQPSTSEQPPSTPENPLNLEKYHAIYGRIFLAALSNGADLQLAIDPGNQLGEADIESPGREERKYNPVIRGLSMQEREDAWGDEGFDYNYAQWSDSLRSSIIISSTDTRKDVIRLFTGKENSNVKEEDIKTLYDTYCRKGSNVDAFVRKALESLGNIEDIEWLAGRLFGKRTAIVVSRIVEIESVYDQTFDGQNQNRWLFTSSESISRLNNLTSDEESLLRLLSTNYRSPSKPKSSDDKSSGSRGNRNNPDNRDSKRRSDDSDSTSREDQRDNRGSRNPDRRQPNEKVGTPETAADAEASVDFEHTLLRSRMIVHDASGEAYSVKKTEQGQPSRGAENLNDLYNLVRISDGEELSPMRKGDLIASMQGDNPEYIRDPLERKKIKSKTQADNGIYILQTQYDRHLGETIVLNVKFKEERGRWFETPVQVFPRDQFDSIFNDQYEIVDDKTPTRPSTSSARDEVPPGTM